VGCADRPVVPALRPPSQHGTDGLQDVLRRQLRLPSVMLRAQGVRKAVNRNRHRLLKLSNVSIRPGRQSRLAAGLPGAQRGDDGAHRGGVAGLQPLRAPSSSRPVRPGRSWYSSPSTVPAGVPLGALAAGLRLAPYWVRATHGRRLASAGSSRANLQRARRAGSCCITLRAPKRHLLR
jgi:hypothetical protein